MDSVFSGPRIVVIGGGTGSFTVLSALKHYVNDVTALVNMADDGGSTGVLRDELGVLPPGDIRQCLVALSDEQTPIRELFNFRFSEGSLSGHSFGNLFLSAVEKMTDDFTQAVEMAGRILNIQGRVLPITTDNVQLVITDHQGNQTKGQFTIEQADFGVDQRPVITLEPEAVLTVDAAEAIMNADMVVIAPGNLYASLAPALIVKGVGECLERTKARVVYVCNLVTKPGQTDGFAVHNFAEEIERFCRREILDYVIYNTAPPSPELLEKYAKKGEYGVEIDTEHLASAHYDSFGAPLLGPGLAHPASTKGDLIAGKRSLIRHDGDKLAKVLMRVYFS